MEWQTEKVRDFLGEIGDCQFWNKRYRLLRLQNKVWVLHSAGSQVMFGRYSSCCLHEIGVQVLLSTDTDTKLYYNTHDNTKQNFCKGRTHVENKPKYYYYY